MTSPTRRELLCTMPDTYPRKPAPPLQGEVLYAYQYCDCIYESGFHIVSLHRTKLGAWRAKQQAQWAKELEAQAETRFRGDWPLTKSQGWRQLPSSMGFMISAVVIQP